MLSIPVLLATVVSFCTAGSVLFWTRAPVADSDSGE
jgi:hypothetical protein